MKIFEFCRNMWKSTKFLSNCKLMIEKRVKNPSKRFMQSVHPFLHEFCANSNIHGVRYFTERMLHWTERLWWIIAFGVSLWLCGSMIQNVWTEWNENPTTFLKEKTHISIIPFPTVTICPQIKNLKHKFDISSKFDKKLKAFANLSDIEATQINALVYMCPILQSKIQLKDDFTDESIYNIIEDLAPSLEYTIQECRWKQKKINCSEYITPMLTRQGVCFTFNAVNSNDMFTDKVVKRSMIAKTNRNVSDWSMESGYKTEFTESEYPIRVLDSGRKGSLELVLSSNIQDHDLLCNGHYQGFILSISTPGEPLESRSYIQTELDKDILITVKPKMIITSKGLLTYKPMQRGCFFSFERQLRFFQSYTGHNCIIECLANFIKKECGCAIFSMPRDAKTKICGVAKIKCYNEAEIKFVTHYRSSSGSSYLRNCNCLPLCTFVQYKFEIDRAKLSMKTIRNATVPQTNVLGQQQTRLTIFFDENSIETKKRVKTYTITDFMAICGGLLGLFLGISALSIIELIYFWTLRLFGIFHRSRSKRKEELSVSIENEAAHDDRDDIINENILIRAIRVLRVFFTELCDNSNIHGFRYFSERGLHWSERLLWLIAFGVSLWFCSSMIQTAWIQWIEDPVTMRSTETHVSVESIPFPTLTICSEIKTMKHKLDVTAALNLMPNLSDIQNARLNALSHVCPILPHLIKYKNNFTNESIYDIIQDITPSIHKSTIICSWHNRIEKCNKILFPVLTDEGLCFTFNALNSHEIYTEEMASEMMIAKNNLNVTQWSLDNGYTNVSADGNYPYQATHKGRAINLLLILSINSKDIEYQCRGYDNGFKLILTMPGEAVDTSQNYLRLANLNQNMIEIRAKLTSTSDGLRSYKPNQRQCFYSFDHSLRFFKIYTKTNCEAECVANFTRIECGCVKFSMPRDNNTKICGGANIKCYKLARWNLFTSKRGKIFHEKCNCLSPCTSIKYTAKIQRMALGHTTLKKIGLSINQQISMLGFTIHHFKEIIQRKESINSLSDFLAVCGGLLGLFLGISLLSIIELIYYFTLRLFCTIKMKRNNY